MTEKIHNFSPEKLQRLSKEMLNSAENLYNLPGNLLKWSLMHQGETDYAPVIGVLLVDLGFCQDGPLLSRKVF